MIELWYSFFSLFNKCDCQTWLSWFSQELLFWHLGSRPRKTVEEEETGGSAKFVPYGQTSTVFAQVVVKSTGHHQEVLLKRVFAPPNPEMKVWAVELSILLPIIPPNNTWREPTFIR